MITMLLSVLLNLASAQQLELFPLPVESQKVMTEIAAEMGEYFDVGFALESYALEVMSSGDMSAALKTKVDSLIEKRNEDLYPKGGVYEAVVYKVVNKNNGSLAGYIVYIKDYIDHALWDGSGVTVYLAINLVVVDYVPFSA